MVRITSGYSFNDVTDFVIVLTYSHFRRDTDIKGVVRYFPPAISPTDKVHYRLHFKVKGLAHQLSGHMSSSMMQHDETIFFYNVYGRKEAIFKSTQPKGMAKIKHLYRTVTNARKLSREELDAAPLFPSESAFEFEEVFPSII